MLWCAASLSIAMRGELMRKDMVCLVSLIAGGRIALRYGNMEALIYKLLIILHLCIAKYYIMLNTVIRAQQR